MITEFHQPVLLNESSDFLITDERGIYFDGTLGFGGHSAEFIKRLSNDAVLIGTDVDTTAFSHCQKKFSEYQNVRLYNFNFSMIDTIAKIESINGFSGIFADLGVSSFQIDDPEAGFTFRQEADLDLRMDKNIPITAADVVNSFSEEDLADILFKYGEEKNGRRLARLIAEKRSLKKIGTTKDLVEVVESITPPNYLTKSLSRVFQALRIYINDELGVLKSFLQKGIDLLLPGGRIVVITYHSLEDRIVKEHFKLEASSCICPREYPVCVCNKEKKVNILTKKPVTPLSLEVSKNNRARSAKLRVAERV